MKVAAVSAVGGLAMMMTNTASLWLRNRISSLFCLSPGEWMQRVGFSLLLLLLLSPVGTAAGVCATPDPGRFFCGDLESGNLSGWSVHDSVVATAPGLNSTGFKVTFTNSGIGSGAGGDSGFGKTIPNGTTYWMDFWLFYNTGFQWQTGSYNSSFKTIDIVGNSRVSGCQNRILLTTWGNGDPSSGKPMFSMYPNYCAGGTDAGGATNTDTEKFPNIVPSFAFVPNTNYHVTIEITSAVGRNGRYRIWVNGTLISDRPNIQTCTDAGGCAFNAIGVGGPQANSGSGQSWSLDEIRYTTTNIAPGENLPAAPSSLVVN